MSRFQPLRRRSVAIALALACAVSAAAGFFAAGTAEARPCNEIWREYYDSAAHTNLVGERLLDCNGHMHTWGITTSHVLVYTFPCGTCGF